MKHIDRGVVAFAAIVTGIHLLVYGMSTGSPLGPSPPSWQGFWDQSQYLRSAAAFAAGNLAPEEHWYALGYPLLAVPFLKLFPADPYFLINTIGLVVFALSFLAYFRPLIGSLASMSAFLTAQLLPASLDVPHRVNFPVWLQYVIPWNTVPVAAALMLILLLVRNLHPDDSKWKDAALGLLASAVVAIRPSDAGPLLVAGAFYFQARVLRQRAIANVSAALMAAGIVLGAYAALSWAIYGGLVTPYHNEVRTIGASASDFHERAYALLIDAGPTHEEPGVALSVIQPWMILALPLALAWAFIDGRGLLAVGAAAVSLASYICFNDFWPYALLRLSLIHYVTWTLPILAGAAVAAAVVVVREKRWILLAVTLTATTALASVDLNATPVTIADVAVQSLPNGYTRYVIACTESQEIDAIDFVGATATDPHAVTMKAFDVTQDGQPLALYRGYRPIQLRGGLRIGFNRYVEAERVAIVLDNTIAHPPTEPSGVRAVRFTLAFGPFRRRRE